MRPPFAPTFGGLLFFLADPSNDRRFLVEDAASSKPKTRAKSGDFERADEKRENREIAPEVVVRSPRVGAADFDSKKKGEAKSAAYPFLTVYGTTNYRDFGDAITGALTRKSTLFASVPNKPRPSKENPRF